MKAVKLILILLISYVSSAVTTHATPQTDLHLGHFEVQIDYELSPDNPDAGWGFSVSYDTTNNFNTADGIVRLDPDNTVIVATPDTEKTLSGAFHGLGDAGDTLWLLPQANRPGQIFFGWRSVIEPGIFQLSNNGLFFPHPLGSMKIELVDVSGPAVDAGGKFAMWESNSFGGVEMHFNTADGINTIDSIDNVPSGVHTHYNYGLTQPGNYEVTFRASARLSSSHGGHNTSGTGTFNYSVPFSSVATGEAELRLGLDEEPGPAAIHPAGETVEYAPGQVALVTQATEVDGILRSYAFGIDPAASNTTVEPHRVGLAGTQPIAFPLGVSLAADPLEILEVTGPGELQLLPGNGDRRYFVFSESGIYRVQLRAVASDGGTAVNGPAFELVFLAGLEADYNFSAYADSFERTHGLTAGSLKDDGNDWDGDGVPDILEYQLFWEGLDPAVADANKLPLPDPNDPEGLIVFHRDTYKDRLNRNSQNIVLEYSSDFTNWTGWSDKNHGWPLEQYETGAERGNAHARIQRRALRLPVASVPDRAFFRWKIDPAD